MIFQRKKSKVVSLTSCQTELRFQDTRDVTHVSVVATASLGLNSLPPLFSMDSDVMFKDTELRQLQNELYSAWRFGTVEVKCPDDPHPLGVMNICMMMVTMRKTCSDAHA
jgi:hypothetical protein